MTSVSYTSLASERVRATNGVEYAYRETTGTGTPLVLLQHFRGNLDNWDPALVLFGNAGVGGSGGTTPATVEAGVDHLAEDHQRGG